jgi:hypothetical protein
MKKVIWVIIILAVIIIIVLLMIFKSTPILKPVVEINSVHFDKANDTIYIKKKNWGITGDYQIIVLSTDPNRDFKPNKEKEYVYEGLISLFYKMENDTLTLYVSKAVEVPEDFKLNDFILQKELTNQEMMNLYETYKEKGIQKF